jgi:hypothetical protein
VLSARMVRTAPAFDLFEMSDAAEPARAELLRSKLESMNGVDGVAVDCRLLACRVKLAVSGDAGSPDAEQRIQTIIRRSFPGAAFSVRTPHDGRNESGLRLSELYVKVPSWESGLQ